MSQIFQAALDKLEPRLARAIAKAFDKMRDRLSEREIAQLIEAKRFAEITAMLDIRLTNEDMQEFKAAMSKAVSEGGRIFVDLYPNINGPAGPINFVFGEQNPKLGEFAEKVAGQRVREITRQTQELVSSVVARESVKGENPAVAARKIKDAIGLTAAQEAAVQNYRTQLETLDRDAIKRELRDKRSDKKILRAIDNGNALTPEQIDSLVNRYRRRFIAYRSKVIARTEALRSLNGSQFELFKQMVDDGRLRYEQIRREWVHTKDGRTRNEHRQIAGMNDPNGIMLNEYFQTPLGPLQYPGDPAGLAENTIQCRCSVFYRILSPEVAGIAV